MHNLKVMLYTPFYNPEKSYEENFEQGPFGAFADEIVFGDQGKPRYDFFGYKVFSPFGIPAGPLINSDFCKGAFGKGFDLCVYKTVRSGIFPCHPHPNILRISVDGDLTLEKAQGSLTADHNYGEPLSITNSFGVPSKEPRLWQEDVRKAVSYAKEGQVLVLSFMGTVYEHETLEGFIGDYARAARLAKDSGARVLEMNLSCPNIGDEGLVCYNLNTTEKICEAVRHDIGDTPLILKVGFYKNESDIRRLVEIAEKYAQGIAAINTIQATILDPMGNQALPGPNRIKSGVCGASIKWAGLEMVKKLVKARGEVKADFKIIGVGGVMNVDDFFEYRAAGADFVMSATGAMWNPYLAQEIKQ